MRRTALPALLLLLLLPATLPAQLDLTLRWGVSGHAGHAEAEGDDRPSMHPGTATAFVLAVGIRHHGWRGHLAVRRAAHDLVLIGDASGILTPGALRDLALSLEVGRRLVGGPGRPTLAIGASLVRHRWSFPSFGDPARGRWGVGTALEAEVPLGGRWQGLVRAEVEGAGSLFDTAELPAGFTRRGGRRGGIGVGLRWQVP